MYNDAAFFIVKLKKFFKSAIKEQNKQMIIIILIIKAEIYNAVALCTIFFQVLQFNKVIFMFLQCSEPSLFAYAFSVTRGIASYQSMHDR